MASDEHEATLLAEIERLNKIIKSLMNRAERDMSAQGSNFGVFQSTIVLEGQVRNRTRELEAALHENEKITRALQHTTERLEREKKEQQLLLHKLEEAHTQLLQSEKLASIGQLAAGIAHEINNPIGFISSNLSTLDGYVAGLLQFIALYETADPALAAVPDLATRLETAREEFDIDYIRGDIVSLIKESLEGTQRVRRIVQDLRDFSRIDSSEWQQADLHQGIDSTLNVVRNEIKHKADIVLDYGELPPVECIPSQLNQVLMNLLVNAAQAIPKHGTITIRTRRDGDAVTITVSDTGVGIPEEITKKIFDPFFTTKPVGKGTGLGLSVSYGIIERHGGVIDVESRPGDGSTFTIRLPVRRAAAEHDAQQAG